MRPNAIAFPADTPGRVTFTSEVSSTTRNGPEAILEGVDLVAEPGQTVAILGRHRRRQIHPVNLVPRFYDVDRAGRSGSTALTSARSSRTRCSRTSASCRRNPSCSPARCATTSATAARTPATTEVIAAAQAAQAHDFIMALSQGYDTHVEQRGRQLLRRPEAAHRHRPRPVDAPAHPDPRRQHQFGGRGNRDANPGCAGRDAACDSTSFVVAQRISTVLKADKIIVIDKGQHRRGGNTPRTDANSPIYREIYESQLGNGAAPR